MTDVRAIPAPPLLSFFLCSVNFQDGIFLLLFDVIKKSVGSLVSAGGGFQSFSPRSPLQGFVLVQERQMLRLNMDPPSVFYHI